jgi:glutamate synthase domain-containing protein 2
MFALGCIQSLSCRTDRCPSGVSTQHKTRSRALVVEDTTERVRNCHRSMLHSLAELTAAAGLEHPQDIRSASPASPRDQRGGERFTPMERVAGASSARAVSSA